MALSRHSFSKKITYNGKSIIATNKTSSRIYSGVLNKKIDCSKYIIKEGERLDTLSLRFYNTSSYWWILAAASGIGWPLQISPGTIIAIPSNLNELFSYVG